MKRMRASAVALALIMVTSVLYAGGQEEAQVDEPVVIEWWGEFTGFEAKGTENAVARFNELHPNIEVVYTGQPDLDTKVIAAVRAGNPPAVVSVGNNQNFPQLVAGGTYTPLDDLMADAGFDFSEYWEPWTTRAMTIDGVTWALPYTNWVEVLVYNKEMFREAGLDAENPPRTIAEFNEAQRALTKYDAGGGIVQTGLSFRTTFPGWFVAYYPYMFGASPADLYDAENMQFLKPDALYEAWEWLQAMAEEYGADAMREFEAGFGGWGTEAEPFLSGKMAMTWNGPWIADHIRQFAPDMDWGVASAPTVAELVDRGPFGWVGIDNFAIPTGAENASEALEFMIWFSGPEGQFSMNTGPEGSGRIPSVEQFDRDAFYEAAVTNPKIQDYVELFGSPGNQPIPFGSPAEQAYNTEFSAILDPVLNLEIDARDAVDTAVERAQAALDRM